MVMFSVELLMTLFLNKWRENEKCKRSQNSSFLNKKAKAVVSCSEIQWLAQEQSLSFLNCCKQIEV